MVQQIVVQNILFYILFGGVTTLSVVACCYLLFRKGNAFSQKINPPIRPRYFTAAFFASIATSHLWWFLFRFAQPGSITPHSGLICMSFDAIVVMPALLCTLLAMLQDRKRSLGKVAIVVVIGLIDLVIYDVTENKYSTACIAVYIILMLAILFIITKALRQYGQWLRENHADLENKEVWQTFVVIGVVIIVALVYAFSSGSLLSETLIEVADILLTVILLWRVETLEDLEENDVVEDIIDEEEDAYLFERIEASLKKNCVDSHFYLHHDASLTQLARKMKTNTTYLSHHFAKQGLNYNSYINGLRIAHFERLYNQAIRDRRGATATELAKQSGFSSYSTFSTAFKMIKHQTVAEWMHRH
ncbi:MAG: AraC family transcriptional regulator [Bacteroidaceae bacterium]|nr:AraC family transcriptional regulator [Bacteroidaceae bacterium]